MSNTHRPQPWPRAPCRARIDLKPDAAARDIGPCGHAVAPASPRQPPRLRQAQTTSWRGLPPDRAVPTRDATMAQFCRAVEAAGVRPALPLTHQASREQDPISRAQRPANFPFAGRVSEHFTNAHNLCSHHPPQPPFLECPVGSPAYSGLSFRVPHARIRRPCDPFARSPAEPVPGCIAAEPPGGR